MQRWTGSCSPAVQEDVVEFLFHLRLVQLLQDPLFQVLCPFPESGMGLLAAVGVDLLIASDLQNQVGQEERANMVPQRSGRGARNEVLETGKQARRCGLFGRRFLGHAERSPTREERGTNQRPGPSQVLAGACQLVGTMSQFWPFPGTRSLGVVERNSFRFFPADRLARSNGTNGTKKRDSSLNSTIPELPGTGWLAAEPEATPQTHRLRPRGFPTVSPSHPSVFPHHGIQRITVEFSGIVPNYPIGRLTVRAALRGPECRLTRSVSEGLFPF